MTKPLLQSELAQALQVSPAVVCRDARRGMPTDSVEAARDWRARHLRPRVKIGQAAPSPATAAPSLAPPAPRPELELDEDRISYEEARRRREAAEAQRAELQLAELRGDLVRMSDVRSAYAKRIAAARQALLQMPSRVTPVIVSDPSAGGIDRALRREISGVLESVLAVGG